MLLGIDHIVIAVRDPDFAAAQLAGLVGLDTSPGGRHREMGTSNRLVWLGDSYLELMGVDDPDLARKHPLSAAALAVLEPDMEGVAAFALATDDLVGDFGRLQAAASPYAAPVPGERETPDGEIVRWQSSLPPQLGPTGLPFLIQHDETAAEWRPEERRARGEQVHPFGGLASLARLELEVDDPVAVGRGYGVGLGLQPVTVDDGGVDFPLGPQLLRLRPRSGLPDATIVILGNAGGPRSVDLFGCRFQVEIAALAPGIAHGAGPTSS
jgi:hypothetical protein